MAKIIKIRQRLRRQKLGSEIIVKITSILLKCLGTENGFRSHCGYYPILYFLSPWFSFFREVLSHKSECQGEYKSTCILW